jgi:hypothetical protein
MHNYKFLCSQLFIEKVTGGVKNFKVPYDGGIYNEKLYKDEDFN